MNRLSNAICLVQIFNGRILHFIIPTISECRSGNDSFHFVMHFVFIILHLMVYKLNIFQFNPYPANVENMVSS